MTQFSKYFPTKYTFLKKAKKKKNPRDFVMEKSGRRSLPWQSVIEVHASSVVGQIEIARS